MKRFVISLTILALIISGSIYSLYVFDKKNDEITDRIDHIQTLYKQNKTDEAEEELTRLDRFGMNITILRLLSFKAQSLKISRCQCQSLNIF